MEEGRDLLFSSVDVYYSLSVLYHTLVSDQTDRCQYQIIIHHVFTGEEAMVILNALSVLK